MVKVNVDSPFVVSSPLIKPMSPVTGNKFQVQSPLLKKPTPVSSPSNKIEGTSDSGCVGGNWSSPPPSKPSFAKSERNSLLVSLFSMIISIPALIGAWCWPALLIALVGGGLTAEARVLGHYLSFGMTFIMMLGLCIYIYEHRRNLPAKNGSWNKWGPFVLMVIAGILVNLDPARHILQDLDIWESPGSSEYRQKCHIEKFRCLSPLGWFMTVFITYSGFTLLLVASFWNANIMDKCSLIKQQWRELRGKK